MSTVPPPLPPPPPPPPPPTEPQPGAPLRTPSLHIRVTWMILALLAGLLLVLSLTVDTLLTQRLESQLRDRLLDRASFASEVAAQVGPSQQLADRLEGDGVSVRLLTSDGDVVTSGGLPAASNRARKSPGSQPAAPGGPRPGGPGTPPSPAPAPGGKASADVVDNGSYLSISEQLDDGTVVELYADRSTVDDARSQVRSALVVGALLVLLLAALLLLPVVRTALGPLTRITDVARGISEGERGRRLRPDRPGTELGRLGVAFDDMLDAVEGAEHQALSSEQRLRDFVSDAAHELRTPVTGIRATSEHLLRDDPDRAERERLLLMLVRESDRAGRLVEDLLTMSHIDRGLELRVGEVALELLVRHCVAARRPVHPDVDFAIAVPDDLVVPGDEQRLTQVLGNLLDNAVQAGGATAHVAISAVPDHSSDGRTQVATLDITDDGPGVPRGDRERIFERLTRLDVARERRRGGVGLGLPIARGIARAHGGDLTCLERPGVRGARFRLTLPRPDPR